MVSRLWLVVAFQLLVISRGEAQPQPSAAARAAEFDLRGAVTLLESSADRSDASARVALPYLRGLIAARDAVPAGGDAASLAPVRASIEALAAMSNGRPGPAEIARLMLQAAAAAAQSERDEMRLYIESAIQMESLQRAAGQNGAPLVSAAELAGDLWLQVFRDEDARRAYTAAAGQVGFTFRVLSGLARSARRLNDTPTACATSRRLVEAWGSRPESPADIAEARAFLAGCAR